MKMIGLPLVRFHYLHLNDNLFQLDQPAELAPTTKIAELPSNIPQQQLSGQSSATTTLPPVNERGTYAGKLHHIYLV